MTTVNHPDKITLDAYSDPQLRTQNANGVYNRFTNVLKNPILNAKGIKLMDTTFINSNLQLNDYNQLMFWYYVGNNPATIRSLANLKCVRLHPSWFIPQQALTTNFTKNRYFNNVPELVAALNAAASTGGDFATYNPYWLANGIAFSYDTTTRKISIAPSSGTGGSIVPAAADDPIVIDAILGTTNPNNRIRMLGANVANGSSSYATATIQPAVAGVSMNARLGFGMSFNSRGVWNGSWNGANGVVGIANSTNNLITTSMEGDCFPILLASQSMSIYISAISGGGSDSTGRKNLLHTIPIHVAPLNINDYSPIQHSILAVPNEIYEITVELLDDSGNPFMQPPNFNTSLSLGIEY